MACASCTRTPAECRCMSAYGKAMSTRPGSSGLECNWIGGTGSGSGRRGSSRSPAAQFTSVRGGTVFALIRGLYYDQNTGGSPRVLRYRGVPTYPSPQAFQLFSNYFSPEVQERDASWPGTHLMGACGGGVKMESADPFPLFMDPARSAEVTWRPRSDVPHRFMDQELSLSVTVR